MSDSLPPLKPDGSPCTLLVVDDEPMIGEMLAAVCKVIGAEADPCTSIHAALELLEKNRYDIIIVDRRMPGMSGVVGMPLLRSCKNGATAYIVGTSADPSPDLIRQWENAGIDSFLEKPIPRLALEKLIRSRCEAMASENMEQKSRQTAPERQVIDPTVKAQLEALGQRTGKDLFKSLLEALKDTLSAHRLEIQFALSNNDKELLTHAAHALKGCARSIGADELADLSAVLEDKGMAGDLPGARAMIQSFNIAADRIATYK